VVPTTFKVTGVVDWECISTVPRWEDEYPKFLYGIDVDEEPDPWGEDDATNLARAELRENWKKVKLQKLFPATSAALEHRVKREFVGKWSFGIEEPKNWVSTLSLTQAESDHLTYVYFSELYVILAIDFEKLAAVSADLPRS
jgi:hypothetical protein